MNAALPIAIAIQDLQTGCGIIARIPLANPQQAAIDLNLFLDRLQIAPPDGETYFQLLENARLPIAFVSGELAKRYVGKPLPLAGIEESLFQQIVSLCRKTAGAYAQCAASDTLDDDDATHRQRVATILHRCLQHTGMAILEHQRARRELPWGLWLDLHGYYGSAEEWGVDTLAITDPLEPLGRSTHCAAAYISILLSDMAGVYGLTARDLVLVNRWSAYWSPLVSLHKAAPGESLPQFVVDLMQDIALRPFAECLQTDQIRRLDTSRLAMQINQIRLQLKQKIPPVQLALGGECTAGQCLRLLEHLSRPWSQVRAQRKFKRRPTSGTTRLCTGFEEMHFYMSGKEFEQPGNERSYSRREFENLFAFRYQENPQQMLQVRQQQLAYSVDHWEVVNQSANGFRLVRSVSGRKMTHGQLLAVCPHDSDRFILAQTAWLMQEKGGGLIAGLKILPGLPLAVAARPLDENEKYQRAFLLPALPAENCAQSLVVPQGWFRSGRRIELFHEGVWQIEFMHVLESGPDFERISFKPA